jgi:hypothetical protein
MKDKRLMNTMEIIGTVFISRSLVLRTQILQLSTVEILLSSATTDEGQATESDRRIAGPEY